MDHEDSGERRFHELDLKLTKAVSEMRSSIERMPLELKIAMMEAIQAQKKECDKEHKSVSSVWAGHAGKIIAALMAVITALMITSMAIGSL